MITDGGEADIAKHIRPGLPVLLVMGVLGSLRCSNPQDPTPTALTELVPQWAFDTWFLDETGFTPDSADFAAYAMVPVGDTLYVVFGAGTPGNRDGALFAAYSTGQLRAISALDEQGALDITRAGETVVIPGVDPCCPDYWEYGNLYTYNPVDGFTKLRNLPNVIHTWGSWYDPRDGSLYVAASSHLGDFATGTGELWRTPDLGATWERLANYENDIGRIRTYDVIGVHHRLYAVRADTRTSCSLVAQTTRHDLWADVLSGTPTTCMHRLGTFGEELLVLGSGRETVYRIGRDRTVRETDLPFTVGATSFHWATAAGDFLYAIADDGRILRTSDLTTWTTLATAPDPLVTITSWPSQQSLVFAGRSTSGSLWRLPL